MPRRCLQRTQGDDHPGVGPFTVSPDGPNTLPAGHQRETKSHLRIARLSRRAPSPASNPPRTRVRRIRGFQRTHRAREAEIISCPSSPTSHVEGQLDHAHSVPRQQRPDPGDQIPPHRPPATQRSARLCSLASWMQWPSQRSPGCWAVSRLASIPTSHSGFPRPQTGRSERRETSRSGLLGRGRLALRRRAEAAHAPGPRRP